MSDSNASPSSSGLTPASPFHPPTAAEFGRRQRADRRNAPTPRISEFSLVGGRRVLVQRKEESEGSFIDKYSTLMLVWVMWISLMNLGDSFFTLVHLQAGGIEVNPVADALLRTGRFGFVFAKGFLIGSALLVLTLHKNFWLARTGLWVSTAAYTALVIYHLSLF